MTLLPPINGRPVDCKGLGSGRNVRDWTTIKNCQEGQIEFWRIGMHVKGEWICAEDAIEFVSRMRLAVTQIMQGGSDKGVREIVEDVVRELVIPNHEDAVARFLKFHRDVPECPVIQRDFLDALIDDYRERVADERIPQ